MKLFGLEIISQESLNWLNSLISGTASDGPSSTKFVYLVTGLAGAIAAFVGTVIGSWVYLMHDCKADLVYWGAVTGLWTTIIGFVTSAKKSQTSDTKEIAIAKLPTSSTQSPPASTTTTTAVTASKTTVAPSKKKTK